MENFLALASVIVNQSQDVANLRSVADRLHASVIEVHAAGMDDSASQTGVLLGRGLALTALHNVAETGDGGRVEPLADVVAIVYGHGRVRGHLVLAEPELDLAILRLDATGLKAAPLASEPPAVGERLVAMGARDEEILAVGVTVSEVESGGSLLLRSTRAIDSRFFGGPVFDGHGRLSAVTLGSDGQARAFSLAALHSLVDRAAAMQ
jgi:hypothetical protein